MFVIFILFVLFMILPVVLIYSTVAVEERITKPYHSKVFKKEVFTISEKYFLPLSLIPIFSFLCLVCSLPQFLGVYHQLYHYLKRELSFKKQPHLAVLEQINDVSLDFQRFALAADKHFRHSSNDMSRSESKLAALFEVVCKNIAKYPEDTRLIKLLEDSEKPFLYLESVMKHQEKSLSDFDDVPYEKMHKIINTFSERGETVLRDIYSIKNQEEKELENKSKKTLTEELTLIADGYEAESKRI